MFTYFFHSQIFNLINETIKKWYLLCHLSNRVLFIYIQDACPKWFTNFQAPHELFSMLQCPERPQSRQKDFFIGKALCHESRQLFNSFKRSVSVGIIIKAEIPYVVLVTYEMSSLAVEMPTYVTRDPFNTLDCQFMSSTHVIAKLYDHFSASSTYKIRTTVTWRCFSKIKLIFWDVVLYFSFYSSTERTLVLASNTSSTATVGVMVA